MNDQHKMQQEDYNGLQEQVKGIGDRDYHLGNVLNALLLHIGHAHGLDPAKAEQDARMQAIKDRRADEDREVALRAEARQRGRELEDKDDSLTHSQANERQRARMQEDKDEQEAADARTARRKAEDERLDAERDQPGEQAPQEPAYHVQSEEHSVQAQAEQDRAERVNAGEEQTAPNNTDTPDLDTSTSSDTWGTPATQDRPAKTRAPKEAK